MVGGGYDDDDDDDDGDDGRSGDGGCRRSRSQSLSPTPPLPSQFSPGLPLQRTLPTLSSLFSRLVT